MFAGRSSGKNWQKERTAIETEGMGEAGGKEGGGEMMRLIRGTGQVGVQFYDRK
jgi:hypothetical protein